MLMDWGLTTQEACSVTEAWTGTGPYTSNAIARGIDGTVAQAHASGASVVHGVTAQDYNEPQVHIATGTSGSAYPNVIHGLQNGSSVVGTTDTQTLSNKTLVGAALTGGISLTESSASGALEVVSNTHSAPSAANVQWVAESAADAQLSAEVSGDTDPRFTMDSNGKMKWGPGGATATDTDLYRESAGVLQTDSQFNAPLAEVNGASSTGEVLQVTNTVTAPTNPNLVVWSETSTDTAIGVRVTGDTKSRLDTDSTGKFKWGAGGSSASDTNLYRNAAAELKTDDNLTVAESLTVGGAQLLAGGAGVVGLVNAGTAPTTTPSGGAVAYAKNGFLKWRGADGLDYNSGHTRALITSPVVTSATGTSSQTITGLDLVLGAYQYELELWAPYVGSGGIASTGTWSFTFGGTTTAVSTVGQFFTSAYTAPVAATSITATFTSPALTGTDTFFLLKGWINVATAGTLQLVIANTTTTDSTTVLAGSWLKATIIA
jgi:hypothetical protein